MVQQGDAHMPEIRIGDPAPDFRLPVPGNKEIGLADFRGKRHVVLAFYPFDWSPG
jgi:thioredoxin-dependent peroxiredoxin